ncbi:MAG: hypothetical protein AAF085_07535 [Planctomycetota bacterium]
MLELLVLAVIGVVVVTVVGAILSSTGKNKAGQVNEPACGACGYPVRGITALVCPECGADLTKVGIVKPGDSRSVLTGCLVSLLVTVIMFLLALGGFAIADSTIPIHENQSTTFDVRPDSDAYSEAQIRTELTLVFPPSDRHFGYDFDLSTNYGPPNTTTVGLGGGPNATVQIESIALEVMSMPMANAPNTITYAPAFAVDPTTRLASWTDSQGNIQTSTGPVTDKDLLAYFAEYNVDTTPPEVASEAQQLTAMINDLIAGQNQFTLQGFQSGGYGSGGSQGVGPPWFTPTYFGIWFVLWIVALVVLVRRTGKQGSGKTG